MAAPVSNGFHWNSKNSDYPPLALQRSQSETMVNWPQALKIATERRGIACRLGSLHFGGVNMIRQIVFTDGIQWIIRIPMPNRIIVDGRPGLAEDYWTKERADEMKCMIYTMKYIRSHSHIPVPEIFHFDVESTNPIGAPYIFMECIPGNAITDLGETIPEPFVDKVHEFMAKFQVIPLSFLSRLTPNIGPAV